MLGTKQVASSCPGSVEYNISYPMFKELTITRVPSGFSGNIWLDTKIVLKKIKNKLSEFRDGTVTAISTSQAMANHILSDPSRDQYFFDSTGVLLKETRLTEAQHNILCIKSVADAMSLQEYRGSRG